MTDPSPRPAPPLSATNDIRRILLALLSLPGLGRKTARRILARVDGPESLESLLLGHKNDYDSKQIADAYSYADKTLEHSEREGIRVLCFTESDFPPLLKQIDDPPVLLHVKGDLAALKSEIAVAIVGTRTPTSFGEHSARKIAFTVANQNVTVVSGLARGCDAAAHWGCIDAHGKTIAVLAHGLDKVYPAENKTLADSILATSGCLVSEYEVGQRAFKTHFVDRDRLQSGLSQALILIESGVVGGSMHTVRFAQQQHRVLACVKHPSTLTSEEQVQGNKKLIAEGQAIPLESSQDVESLLSMLRRSSSNSDYTPPPQSNQPTQLSMF